MNFHFSGPHLEIFQLSINFRKKVGFVWSRFEIAVFISSKKITTLVFTAVHGDK